MSDENRVTGDGNTKTKGPFGFTISITQFSVSITHNLKMVGLITKRLFGKR